MKKFFKITMPNEKTFVVVTKGYASLIDLLANAPDKEHTYITQISLFEFLKYIKVEHAD